jgi:polyhydroxybutyrate depolymerase
MTPEFLSTVITRWIFAACLSGAILACRLQAQDAQLPQEQRESQIQRKPAQPAQSQAHDAQEEVQINEHTRTFVVHLPQGYDSQQHYPVAIMLHGRDQDAAEMARLTHFNQFADQDGIIAVYPNALNGRRAGAAGQPPNYRRGPYGRRGPFGRGPGYPPGQRNDPERRQGAARGPEDIPFLNRVIDKVATHYSVDTRRIYAIGLGEGGFMAMRMGCNMADRIAAFATVAAAMPKNLNCIPSRPTAVLLMNGTDDHIVNYGGGHYKDGMLELLSAENSAKEWARLNRCSEKPTESKLPALQKGGKDTKVYLFDGCRENAQVALYAIKDGGHTWPGGEQYMSEKEVGKTSNALNANETIWSFLVTRKITGESGVEK